MKILVLNGSSRPHGNTAAMVAAFAKGAQENGHQVDVVNVCQKKIAGCLACEYCHKKDSGHERQCVQQDDMQEVYPLLDEARTHCSEGSGLGLAIVKRIVMDHQGSIYAKNSGGLEICMEFSAS